MTPDYYVLWGRLERKLMELRQGTMESLCVADEINKVKVLQGAWGAYGFVFNEMQRMIEEVRNPPKSET